MNVLNAASFNLGTFTTGPFDSFDSVQAFASENTLEAKAIYIGYAPLNLQQFQLDSIMDSIFMSEVLLVGQLPQQPWTEVLGKHAFEDKHAGHSM